MWPPQSPSCPEARGHTPATAGGHILLTCSPDRTASAQSPGRPHLTGWCFPIWLRPSSWLSQTRPSGLSCFLAASCASAGPTAQPKPLAVPHTRRMLRAQLVCTCCSCNSACPHPRVPPKRSHCTWRCSSGQSLPCSAGDPRPQLLRVDRGTGFSSPGAQTFRF